MSIGDIILIIFAVIVVIAAGFYIFNKWAYKKIDAQQSIIDKSKQRMSIYVIDKRKDKITNINMPKMVIEQIPKFYKFIKMYFVQAKVGPQIVTLMCDKRVFEAIPVKKNVKVEIAGIYIVSVMGMKTPEEIKAAKKAKKEKEKAEKKASKKSKKKA